MPAMLSDKSMAVSPARCSADQLRLQSEVGVLTPCTQIVPSPMLSVVCHDVRGDVPNSTKSLRTSKECTRKDEWSFRCIFPIDESLSSLVVLNESAECPSRIKGFELTKSIPLMLWISLFSQPP
jgi:hypothetical protein